MSFGKLRGKSADFGKSDMTMTRANGKHLDVSDRHPMFSEHIRPIVYEVISYLKVTGCNALQKTSAISVSTW